MSKIKVRFAPSPTGPLHIGGARSALFNHLRGELCSNCEDVIVTEMGKLLFYSAALCNTLDLNLYDVFLEEYKKASTLGVFNLT